MNFSSHEPPAGTACDPTRREALKTLAALPLAATLPAQAQGAWPSKPIRVVVPSPPGGGTDHMARALTDRMREILGATFVVENRAGATTVIGTEYVSTQPADGYTLLFASPPGFTIVPHLRPVKYSLESFETIGAIGNVGTMVVAKKDLPVETLGDLIALCKRNPGKISWGSPGVGSLGHLAGEVFARQAGIDVLHVPYNGSAPLVTAALGGQVDYILNDAVVAHIKEGRLKGLAMFVDKPLPGLPQVPPIRAAGMNAQVPLTPMGLLAPKGTPKPILEKLTAAVQRAMQDSVLTDKLPTFSVPPQFMGPEEFMRLLVQGRDLFGQVVREKGIKDTG